MSEPHTPMVRVVVLNWNAAWFTRRCLRALEATEYPGDRVEVVLVDNASVDGSLEQLRASFPELRIVANTENLGFAEGCNRAMRDRGGVDYVALVNNDAVPEPGWLWPLVEQLEATPRAGAASPLLLLEPAFCAVELHAANADIGAIHVDGLDVTRRTRFEGTRVVADPQWPMDVTHHVEGRCALMVPVEPGSSVLEVRLSGSGPAQLSSSSGSVEVELVGEGLLEVPAGLDRVELVNALGTGLDDLSEGFDRSFGRPVETIGTTVEEHDDLGFCGGGVLLRSSMLDRVGLFDPALFAYYEDTDLAWRSRLAGWTTVTVPRSIIRHAFGGSAGSRAAGFFFLNYRNWMLTALRNAGRARRSRMLRSAVRRTLSAVLWNVVRPLRSGRRPDLTLVGAWMRVWLGVASAAPRVLRTGRGGAIGASSTERVRSRLQPAPAHRDPVRRIGGPRLVHLDCSPLVGQRSGSASEATRYLVPLARSLADVVVGIDTLLVAAEPRSRTGFRLLSPAEVARILEVAPPVASVPSEPREVAPAGPGGRVLTLDARRLAIRTSDGTSTDLRRIVRPAEIPDDQWVARVADELRFD